MKAIFSSFILSAICSAGLMASPTVQVTLENAGSPMVANSNGVYVGPYTLSVNGLYLPALCVDNKDWSSLNSTWTANVTKLSGATNASLSNTYNPGSLTEYEESAVLYNMITAPKVTGNDRINLQQAAWDIMDYNITNQATLTSAINAKEIGSTDGAITYIDDAMNDYSSMSMTGYEILTAANGPREQEFIVYNPATCTPEPTTYALLGLGLIVLGGSRAFFNKRKAAQQQTTLALIRRLQ